MFGWGPQSPSYQYDELSTPQTIEDYQCLADQVLDKQNSLIVSNVREWEVINAAYTNSDILVEQKYISGSDIVITRSTGQITLGSNMSLYDLVQRIYAPTFEQRKALLPHVISYETVHTLTKDIHVAFTLADSGTMFVSHREFLAMRTMKQLSDHKYIIGIQSINDPNIGCNPNYVRGISSCGICIEQINDTQIKIISVDHIDPKGSVPIALINRFKSTIGDWIKKL